MIKRYEYRLPEEFIPIDSYEKEFKVECFMYFELTGWRMHKRSFYFYTQLEAKKFVSLASLYVSSTIENGLVYTDKEFDIKTLIISKSFLQDIEMSEEDVQIKLALAILEQ